MYFLFIAPYDPPGGTVRRIGNKEDEAMFMVVWHNGTGWVVWGGEYDTRESAEAAAAEVEEATEHEARGVAESDLWIYVGAVAR